MYTNNIDAQNLDGRKKITNAENKIMIFMIFSCLIFFFYLNNYYQNQANELKVKITNDSSKKIFEIIETKINDILTIFPDNEEIKDSGITINRGIIEICGSEDCIKYDLLKINQIIDNFIPNHIDYKISIKDFPIYSKNSLSSYTLDRITNLENISIRVQLDIDSAYWGALESEIRKPFWTIFQFITFSLILLCVTYKITAYKLQTELATYLFTKSKVEVDKIISDHTAAFNRVTDELNIKIWDLDSAIKSDIDINYVFTQEIAKNHAYAEAERELDPNNRINNFYNSSYPIVLLAEGSKEKINPQTIKKDFESRFNSDQETLSVKVSDHIKFIHFFSRGALYQVIYGLTSHLFFILKQFNPKKRHKILLTIDEVSKKLILRIEIDEKIELEKDKLSNYSKGFFKSHANIFLMDIKSISELLKNHGYDYHFTTNRIGSSVIEIIESGSQIHEITNEDYGNQSNVIAFSGVRKKKK